jgi:small subunit ribosomal protein S7
MPRRAVVTRRPLDPDPVYGSTLATQLINKVLKDGKKSTSERIVYGALERIRDRTGRDPVQVTEEAIRNVTPMLEVKSRRVGGATYQVPIEVPPRRGRTLAVRWIVGFSKERREKQMSERLANELLDALGSQGGAFKRKDDIYRMAQANKAFAHYRW